MIKKTSLLVMAALCLSLSANAQKIGRVLFQEVLLVLPEIDSVQANIQKQVSLLEDDLEQMQVEFNNKIEDYEQKKATYSDAIRQQKEKELQDYNTRINEFSQTAQREVQNIQMQQTQPLITKVGEAVQKVAKEQGITMVVDLTQGNNIIFLDETTTTDITPLVKVSLGVAADAKPKMAAQQQPLQ